MQIDVPKSPQRGLDQVGQGVATPYEGGWYAGERADVPYEIATRLSDLGRLDFSAQPVPDATRDDFDPLNATVCAGLSAPTNPVTVICWN